MTTDDPSQKLGEESELMQFQEATTFLPRLKQFVQPNAMDIDDATVYLMEVVGPFRGMTGKGEMIPGPSLYFPALSCFVTSHGRLPIQESTFLTTLIFHSYSLFLS